MHRAWIAFAHRGDPNHDALPAWPAYDTAHRATMHFDVTCGISEDDHADVRAAWQEIALFS
jgi:para-nitrobenzyl esterase